MNTRKNMAAAVLTLLLGMALFVTGCGSIAKQTETAKAPGSYDKAQEYLWEYFGIEPGQEVTLASVNGMIGALGGTKIDAETLTDGAVIEAGTPAIPSPTYAVEKQENGRYLCSSVEYDLMIEFDTAEEKERFHSVIETYAKKYDDRVDDNDNVTAKLLAESWWQPLYSSGTPMEDPEFVEMIDNVVYDRTSRYSIHAFSLPEDASAIADKVAQIAPDLSMSPFKIYVNPAFKRYITGEDHQ